LDITITTQTQTLVINNIQKFKNIQLVIITEEIHKEISSAACENCHGKKWLKLTKDFYNQS